MLFGTLEHIVHVHADAYKSFYDLRDSVRHSAFASQSISAVRCAHTITRRATAVRARARTCACVLSGCRS